MTELWDDKGIVSGKRHRDLHHQDIVELLKAGPVRFMVAEIGLKPRWIAVDDCYKFWKDECKKQVLPSSTFFTDELPDGGGYWAEEWQSDIGPPVVALYLVS